MKLIGTGKFTRAYLNEEKKVILKSVCPIKECMSLDFFPDSKLFPKVESLEYDLIPTYKMEYYPRTRGLKKHLKPKQWEIYKQLREIYKGVNYDWSMRKSNVCEQFKKLKNKRLRSVMIDAYYACRNYGTDICFEISPRNVGHKNGKLILLDVFYQRSQKSLREVEKLN